MTTTFNIDNRSFVKQVYTCITEHKGMTVLCFLFFPHSESERVTDGNLIVAQAL